MSETIETIETTSEGLARDHQAAAAMMDGPDGDAFVEGGTLVPEGWNDEGRERRLNDTIFRWLGLFVATVCSLFVFSLLNWPDTDSLAGYAEPLLFLDTTPSGGDMGAHVWGPAFLRDYLLPDLRLSGWTPDWYAGFPAYHFYMVVPSLAIVALNAGFHPFIGIPLAIAGLVGARVLAGRADRGKIWIWIAGLAVAALVVSFPYGVSFKLISVSGLLFFPIAAWLMGRLAGSPEPIPSFLALASFLFLFDTNFNIYGGNIASTLAGEFAFSISLCLTLLAIGVVIKGMDESSLRASAAVLLALVALCHLIPIFFLIPAVALTALTHRRIPLPWPLAATVALAIVPMAFAEDKGFSAQALAIGAVIVVAVAAAVAEPTAWQRIRWLLFAGPVSILLAAFWLMPFYLREPYFNDMGWERLNEVGPPMLTAPMKVALPMAAVGVLLSYAYRERIGMVFGATGLIFASAVANIGEGALWNARLLPFYYISVYMLAAIGTALVLRHVGAMASNRLHTPSRLVLTTGTGIALFATLIAVAMPLRTMPGGQVTESGAYQWLVFRNTARSFIPTWVDWNYSGYERKDSYREYAAVVDEMAALGDERGCGRAMWEYEKGLDRYGTPMALMLLPHWTDGCIGSMEGLYFESSATTPFHFLNQSMLSESPSRAQRDLPYQSFDITRGIEQLQIMGVKYYLAQTDAAIEAAMANPALERVGESQPFVMFEVSGSELVEPLSIEPVVVTGPSQEQVAGDEEADKFDVGWVSQAVEFFNNPGLYAALPAESGPPEWESHSVLSPEDGLEVSAANVTDVVVDTSRISFRVDRTGTPILVKASYFPNWKVSGATGPWRVGPNLMVVVPDSERVTLDYGRTGIDWIALGLTALGAAVLASLVLVDRRRWMTSAWESSSSEGWDEDALAHVGGGLAPRGSAPRWGSRQERSLPDDGFSPYEEFGTAAGEVGFDEGSIDGGAELSEVPNVDLARSADGASGGYDTDEIAIGGSASEKAEESKRFETVSTEDVDMSPEN